MIILLLYSFLAPKRCPVPFYTGPGVTTLPIKIFAYLQFQGSQLVIAAASTLQISLIVVLVLSIERLVGLANIVR